MRLSIRLSVGAAVLAMAGSGVAGQTPAVAGASAAPTDVYSVMFVKAAPGQAAALAKQLQEADPKDPMGTHFLLLRHQEGADWDYCLIQHAGAKATVEITPQAAPSGMPTMAWHEDTYVAGPSWPEFQRAMGMSGTQAGHPVYIVGVHRAAPGLRTELQTALAQRAPDAKSPSSNLVMTHLDGGSWQFLTVTRYSSWQALAAEQAEPGTGDAWLELRKYSAFHSDTIADRVQ
jgi:hypothetical protein